MRREPALPAPTPPETRIQRLFLRCGGCGRTRECGPADLARYAREGWPRCCGVVTTFGASAEKPTVDDTAIDVPPLSN